MPVVAELRPFRGLRYDQAAVGGLGRVLAPPYDVISPEARDELYAASPYNVVRLEYARPEEGRSPYQAAAAALEAIPRPVIAAIRGYALGGGLEIAMACDLRIAGDDARLGQPEILLGIIPGGGGTQRLPRLVGTARAKELIWSGRQVGADEALAMGLVDRVVPAADVDQAARGWAGELAAGAVVAMGLAKRAVHAGLGAPLGDGLKAETEAFAEAFSTEDASAGIASFLEHGPGKATFSGR
ncbi:MAG: DUF1015 family protein [Actinobacteria bacterium]|nr:DUF1015 family protein [Actinomycetota bacterium]